MEYLVEYPRAAGPDLTGGAGSPGPRPPTNKGPPPNPSYFIFGSIDTHNSCVYATYASMMPRINFFHILIQAVYILLLYSVSQKNPPWNFLTFFLKQFGILVQILHAYYSFLSTLDYKFLFNYLQLWRGFNAILSATTIMCSKCPPSTETRCWVVALNMA